MYLLDTCVVSDFVKGDNPTLERLKATDPSHLFLSSISIMEIAYGLQKNPQKADRIQSVLQDFMARISVLEFGLKEAQHAGLIRSYLMKQGTPIGPYDILIAATALHHDLILVTANMGEFQRVQGLVCQNWR